MSNSNLLPDVPDDLIVNNIAETDLPMGTLQNEDSETSASSIPPLVPPQGLKPGQPALWGGRWQQREAGEDGTFGRIVRAHKGQPLPATPKAGMRYFYLGTGK